MPTNPFDQPSVPYPNPNAKKSPNVFDQLAGENGYSPTVTSADAGPSYWPDKDDVALAKKYDWLYGHPAAPNATPGAAYDWTVPLDLVPSWYKNPSGGNTQYNPHVKYNLNTEADADRIREQALASERSAVAKLGYEPGNMISTPPRSAFLTLRGAYDPISNIAWYDQNTPAAAMHESTHRGIKMLRDKGLTNVPKGSMEEAYVRALMQRNYGDIEQKQYIPPGIKLPKIGETYRQLEEGRRLKNDPMVELLERLAAEEIARKHPGGPR